MQPTHRVRFEYALQSDLLRAIRRHRRTAEDHYTREPKRAEISRLRGLLRHNPQLRLKIGVACLREQTSGRSSLYRGTPRNRRTEENTPQKPHESRDLMVNL